MGLKIEAGQDAKPAPAARKIRGSQADRVRNRLPRQTLP